MTTETKKILSFGSWGEAFDAAKELVDNTTLDGYSWIKVRIAGVPCMITATGGYQPLQKSRPVFKKGQIVKSRITDDRGIVTGVESDRIWVQDSTNGVHGYWNPEDLEICRPRPEHIEHDIDMDALQMAEVYDEIEAEERTRAHEILLAKECVRKLNAHLHNL